MQKNMLKKIKEMLLDEKKRLEERIEKTAHEMGDDRGNVLDAGDVAADFAVKIVGSGIQQSDSVMLQRVDDALKRIEDGSYGKCLSCKKKISIERLEVVPTAENCIKCANNG